jgi:hypothetical protein
MTTLLTLRLRVLYRIILEIGLVRTLFVACLLVYALFQVFALHNNYIILTINVLLILSLHISRSDKQFLRTVEIPVVPLFFVEYLTLSVPFLLCLLANQGFWEVLALPFSLLGIALIPFTWQSKNLRLQSFRFIPAQSFEWRAGMKQSWFMLAFAYLGSAIFYQSATLLILCIALVIIMVATFYLYGEDKILVQLLQLSSAQFLIYKIKRHVFLSVMAIFPLLFWFCAFHSELWFVAVLLLIINIFMQVFVILQKYAVWYPNGNLQPNMTLYLFYFMSFVIPFLLPVGIFLLVRAYRKAMKNLAWLSK